MSGVEQVQMLPEQNSQFQRARRNGLGDIFQHVDVSLLKKRLDLGDTFDRRTTCSTCLLWAGSSDPGLEILDSGRLREEDRGACQHGRRVCEEDRGACQQGRSLQHRDTDGVSTVTISSSAETQDVGVCVAAVETSSVQAARSSDDSQHGSSNTSNPNSSSNNNNNTTTTTRTTTSSDTVSESEMEKAGAGSGSGSAPMEVTDNCGQSVRTFRSEVYARRSLIF